MTEDKSLVSLSEGVDELVKPSCSSAIDSHATASSNSEQPSWSSPVISFIFSRKLNTHSRHYRDFNLLL